MYPCFNSLLPSPRQLHESSVHTNLFLEGRQTVKLTILLNSTLCSKVRGNWTMGTCKKKRSYLIVAFVNAIQIETNMITNEQLRGINYVRNWSIQSSENNNQRDMNTHLRNVSCWVCYCIQPSCMPITAPVFFLFPSQSDSIDTGLVFNTKWNTNRIHSKKRMKWNGNGNKKTNRLVKERKKKRKGKEMKWNKWVILPDRALDPLWLNWGNISGTRFSSVIGLLDRYMQSHITDLKYWRNL